MFDPIPPPDVSTDAQTHDKLKALINTAVRDFNGSEKRDIFKWGLVRTIHRVYTDRDTEFEVLYVDTDGHPQTAYVNKETRAVCIGEGW